MAILPSSRRLRSIALALALLQLFGMLGLAPSARAQAFPDPVIPQTFGVQLKSGNHDAANLDAVRDLGLKFVRRGFIWASVEKKPGVYDFSEYDKLMDDCRDRDLTVLGCIALNNKAIGPVSEDKGRAGFAAFAAALADRYKGRKVVWEIWNEPNIQTFWGKHGKANSEQFAKEYAALVLATVPAMKKADPACLVMAGSVSGVWSASYEWTGFCFKEGILKSGIDAWSVHPYTTKCPEDYIEAYARIRKMMTDLGGVQIPMVDSERGYPLGKAEGSAGGDEKRSLEFQANHLVRQYLIDMLSGMKMTNWYEWSGKEGFSLRQQGNPTPAFAACKVMIDQLSGYRLDKRIDLESPRDFALRFADSAGGVKLVVWAAPEPDQPPDSVKPHEVQIPLDGQGPIPTCRIDGEPGTTPIKDGSLRITIDGSPTYVTVHPSAANRPAAATQAAPSTQPSATVQPLQK